MREGIRPTTRLGGYVEYAPPPATCNHIDALWVHRTPAGNMHNHLVIPDPRVSLVYLRNWTSDREAANGNLAVIGPVTRARPFEAFPGREMIAVRMRLEAVAEILGLAPAEHLDEIDGIGDLAGFRDLSERLAAEPDHMAVLETMLAWVKERIRRAQLANRRHGDDRFRRALALVGRRGAHCRIGDIAEDCGLSVRHFRRLARPMLGLGPKELARLLRIERAVLAADKCERPNWADIACAAGFADQAHLIRDCRFLTGLTPRTLFLSRRRESITHELAFSDALAPAQIAGMNAV